MTELSPQFEATRADVDTASVGLLTIDTNSQAITSCNDAFADVLGRAAADVVGCPITDFIDDEVKPVATAVMEGIRAGFISSVDGNLDLLRPVGSRGVDCWILALGTHRPHNMAMAGVIAADGTDSPEIEPSERGFRPPHVDPGRTLLATLDADWRIVEMAPGSAGQLGLPTPTAMTGLPRLHDLAHAADTPILDGSFGRRSSKEASDAFALRLRGPGEQWLPAQLTVSPLRGEDPGRFALVGWLKHAEEPVDSESARVARLEDQLARIRQVVQASEGDASTRVSDLRDLTIRQREIVERLLDGHRVDAIARDLYVSPSTVRNHLSAIFEKLGVASQSELIELLRDPSTGAKPNLEPGGS